MDYLLVQADKPWLKLVDYVLVQADKPWYYYYISECYSTNKLQENSSIGIHLLFCYIVLIMYQMVPDCILTFISYTDFM